jgi:hypothetical protein
MTQDALYVLGGILMVAVYGAQVADYTMTVKALDKGKTEVGFLASKVVKKWGKGALPTFTFLSAVGVTVLAAAFGTAGAGYLVGYSATLLALQVDNLIRNSRQ